MAPRHRVSTEEAALVFRRAVELDTIAFHGGTDAVLDLEALEEVGAEVGLTSESIRQALEELDGEAFQEPPRLLGITASRVVTSDRAQVLFAVNELAERHLLALRTRIRATWTWRRRAGTRSALRRALLGRRSNPLLALRELQATVTSLASDPGLVRVRLDAAIVALTVPATAVVVAGALGGAGGMVWAFQNPGSDAVVATCAGVVGVGASGVGVRKYRAVVSSTEEALNAFLDRLTFAN